jgi:Rod binding domain-containing protein
MKIDPLHSPVKTQKPAREEQIEKAAKEFESYFLFTMLKEMDKTTKLGKKENTQQSAYMAVVHEKVASVLAERGVGIKDAIVKNMTGLKKIPRGDDKVIRDKGDLSPEVDHEDNR